MGIAPFTTTWEITVHGIASAQLNMTRGSLGEEGALFPANMNVTIPLNFHVNTTIYTPWPVASGWDQGQTPTAGDPSTVMTRHLLGFMGADHGANPDYLPGLYISPMLDHVFEQSSSTANIANTEGFSLAGLLSGLPDRVVGASASWSENLTRLENATNSELARTGSTYGGYLATIQQGMTTIDNLVTAHGFSATLSPSGHAPGAYNAYFGEDFMVGLSANCLNYFDSNVFPPTCGGAPAGYGAPRDYTLNFAGPRAAVTYSVDDPYVGVAPGIMIHGFSGSWGNALAGTHTLNAGWMEFKNAYSFTLTSPSLPPSPTVTSSGYPDLAIPYRGPAIAAPATLSVWGVGGLPGAATAAFQKAQSWLPYPGVFESYVTEEQYAAGYLFDNLTGPSAENIAGVSSFGFSTNLSISPRHSENYSTYVQNLGGLFGNDAERSLVLAFIVWWEANNRALCYDLGAPSADPTVLSTATPSLLADAFRNVSFAEGPNTSPWLLSWSSANLAFTEGDLGGASGGLQDFPAVEVGGTSGDGWGVSGSLTVV
jgi:hypothetical protein